MTASSPDFCSIFDLCLTDDFIGLREVSSSLQDGIDTNPPSDVQVNKSQEDDNQVDCNLVREVSDKMVCSTCKSTFINREEQREHYKLDWHRFNIKQKMTGLPPLTAEEFENKTGAGDLSSISGSESESQKDESDSDTGGSSNPLPDTDDETLVGNQRVSSKVIFQNTSGEYLSVHRCVLLGKSEDEQDAGSSLKAINKKTVWIILMTGGGHFAGAVFEGKQVLQHKTFHRYTVRAKRGTAQGLRDSQNKSHAPKSAGAALRRYNEAALVKDIQDLLLTWAEHLKEASAIFIRAPSYNKTIFFGGRAAPLDKKDSRIRTIPFATRRATFREVQRVQVVLSTVQVYGKDSDLSAVFSPTRNTWKKAIKAKQKIITDHEEEAKQESSDEEDTGSIQLETVELTLGTLDLREFEVNPSRQKRRRRKMKDKKPNEEPANQEEESPEIPPANDSPQEMQHKRKKKGAQSKKQPDEAVDEPCDFALRDELFTTCKVGDADALHSLLQLPEEMTDGLQQSQRHSSDAMTFLNKPIDASGFTLLHVATAAAQKAVIQVLLDAGADPACRDNKGQTPYVVAPDKDTRKVFQKYMGENPDKYDYIKAKVPGPLTAELESKKLEKKKTQKAQKKQRDKEQKDVQRKQQMEAEEKKRFASLTDREKRALAAEKRLAAQVTATGINLSNVQRCWMCGESVLGKIPFHYMEFSFCSPHCVQAHRKTNAVKT
ncbi:ankyrin repeat and zinc finger domain-containing protein 1 isoform X2 [Gouania willdenowi]|uniref:VLRF1 domain-containing protein n=1 Tax=Gouania willdenowi TaxID=441366 RepID=A0A8C5HRV7_GOUWI|nr:ankyrin repeat and zinc finger domain-containing protein 1 isoform X2 [Gouania willdenowi]